MDIPLEWATSWCPSTTYSHSNLFTIEYKQLERAAIGPPKWTFRKFFYCWNSQGISHSYFIVQVCFPSLFIVRLKWCRKAAEVQSSLWGDMILRSGIGITAGTLEVWECDCGNSLDQFFEGLSAAVFIAPGIWEAIFWCQSKLQRTTKIVVSA